MPPPEETNALPRPETCSIALALSGGGFRATLFHLGVIRFMYENQLLRQVTHICSVSGGSILAAHLALNWENYLDDKDSRFGETVDHLIDFIRSDVRGTIIRRWLFSWLAWPLRILPRYRHRLGALLGVEYARLFDGKKMSDLQRKGEAPVPPPRVSILAASLTTGRLCAFDSALRPGSAGFHIVGGPPPIIIGELPAAIAVAASSAFPVLFEPVAIDHTRLKCKVEQFDKTEYLTDGGVFENLGLWMLRDLYKKGELPAHCISLVSDAQLPFDWEGKARFGLLFARAMRTTDVVMKRITQFEYEAADRDSKQQAEENKPAFQLIHCKSDEEIAPVSTVTPEQELQRKAAMVRTDLDRFSEQEIDALIRHGYTHARRTCVSAGLVRSDCKNSMWSPVKPGLTAKASDLDGSEKQPLLRCLLGWDRYTLANIVLVPFWLLVVWFAGQWLASKSNLAYRTLFHRAVPASFENQHVENLDFVAADNLSPMVHQAKEMLQRMAVSGGQGATQQTVYLRLRAKLSGNGSPTKQAPSWLVYPRVDDYPSVGHWVFRVRIDENGHELYEALDVTLAHKDGKPVAGAFQFTVPPADPGDSLLVLAAVKSARPSTPGRSENPFGVEGTTMIASSRKPATCPFVPVFVLVLVATYTPPATAQLTISGQVLDAAGSGVDNVVVTLHLSDGTQLSYTTPMGGKYQFPNVVAPGQVMWLEFNKLGAGHEEVSGLSERTPKNLGVVLGAAPNNAAGSRTQAGEHGTHAPAGRIQPGRAFDSYEGIPEPRRDGRNPAARANRRPDDTGNASQRSEKGRRPEATPWQDSQSMSWKGNRNAPRDGNRTTGTANFQTKRVTAWDQARALLHAIA